MASFEFRPAQLSALRVRAGEYKVLLFPPSSGLALHDFFCSFTDNTSWKGLSTTSGTFSWGWNISISTYIHTTYTYISTYLQIVEEPSSTRLRPYSSFQYRGAKSPTLSVHGNGGAVIGSLHWRSLQSAHVRSLLLETEPNNIHLIPSRLVCKNLKIAEWSPP